MPQKTLEFAVRLWDECLEARRLLKEKETEEESVIDQEAAYVDLIDDLAGNPMVLQAIPEMLDHLQELPTAVFSHLLLRTLQTNWHEVWLSAIQEGELNEEAFSLLGFTPNSVQNTLLPLCLKTEGLPRRLASRFIARNKLIGLTNELPNYKKELANIAPETIDLFVSLEASDTDALLSECIKSDDPHIAIEAAQGFIRRQNPKGLFFIRDAQLSIDIAEKVTHWLLLFGSKEHEHALLQRLQSELSRNIGQTCDDEALKSIVTLIRALNNSGDLDTAIKLHNHLLNYPNPRISYEVQNLVLNLFDLDYADEGWKLLESSPIVEDSLGLLRKINPQEMQQFWSKKQNEAGNGKRLLPEGRFRFGWPLNPVPELIEQLKELDYGELDEADSIRYMVAAWTGYTLPLDAYAPYVILKKQSNTIINILEHYQHSEYYQLGCWPIKAQWGKFSVNNRC